MGQGRRRKKVVIEKWRMGRRRRKKERKEGGERKERKGRFGSMAGNMAAAACGI